MKLFNRTITNKRDVNNYLETQKDESKPIRYNLKVCTVRKCTEEKNVVSCAYCDDLPKIILGRTVIKVPTICYGASRTQEPALVKTVLDKEINFFDTRRSHANGQNEVMLGKALKGLRKQVVIQSKIKLRINERGKELQLSNVAKKIKKRMEYSLHASLIAC